VKRTYSVLFVCTGNTCRSPLAERILKTRLKQEGIEGIRVASAGTGAMEGVTASAGTRGAARRMGVSMARFKSRPLNRSRIARADLILTMTRFHKGDVEMMLPDAAGKTFVLSDYTSSGRGGIVDPVGGSDAAYAACAADLSDEIELLLPKLRRAKRTAKGE
jgi:protein-tyrosine-phosphatase